jgi:retron-type reverse transcriptase
MVAQWLKAGVVEQGRLHRTEDGVPQGGVVSPLRTTSWSQSRRGQRGCAPPAPLA